MWGNQTMGTLLRGVGCLGLVGVILTLGPGCFTDWDDYRGVESGEDSGGGASDDAGAQDSGEADTGEPEADSASSEDTGASPDADSGEADTSMDDTTSGDTADTATPDTEVEDTGVDAEEDVANDATPDTAPEDTSEPDTAPPWDCATFALPKDAFYVHALHTTAVTATGGSGAYRWSFPEGGNLSGAILDQESGSYLAGEVVGVADAIEVVDVECGATLTAQVHVVPDARIEPPALEIPPNTDFCFEVVGGSGSVIGDQAHAWVLVQEGSGVGIALDEEGCYRSGEVVGTDIIQAEDLETGRRMDVYITVTRDPIEVKPSLSRVMVPAGESFSFSVVGGSSSYRLEHALEGATASHSSDGVDSMVTIEAGMIGGDGTLRIVDAHLPRLAAEVEVSIMARSEHPANPYGSLTDEYTVRSVGDINNDGYSDVVLGGRQFAVNGYYSGAAYVYLGGAGGLEASPAQVIPGAFRNHYLGRAIASGDFNGDGCRDVAVGAWGGNFNGGETGEVQLWIGCQEELPPARLDSWNGRLGDNAATEMGGPLRLWKTLVGEQNALRFGWGITVGDFDNDGRDDLAVSAPIAESPLRINPNNDNPYSNVGQIFLFTHPGPGDDWEFGEAPKMVLHGAWLTPEGDYVGDNNLQVGWDMATADVNGDGCDELLVGSGRADNYYGFAALFMSEADAGAAGGCMLAELPALEVHSERVRQGRMGWSVDFGDFNGDCRPDLVISEPLIATIGGSNTQAGAVNVFFSQEDWAPGDQRRLVQSEADVIVNGDDWDQFGWQIAVGDVTGDGIDDLLAGSRNGEHDGTATNIGEVRVYQGMISAEGCQGSVGEEEPVLTELHRIINASHREQDLYGANLIVTSDMDGDDVSDWAVFAPRGPGEDDLADLRDHTGRLYWFASSIEAPVFEDGVALEVPAPSSLDYFGWDIASVGDLNRDGYVDFVAGIPYWDRDEPREGQGPVMHGSAGAAALFWGGPDGLRGTPDALLSGYLGHTGSDLMGYSVASAGDFDGDGSDDLAVGVLLEDNNTNYCQTPCRAGGPYRGNTGAVMIYRGGTDRTWPPRFEGDDVYAVPRITGDPDFVICGPQINEARIAYALRGGFDANGDGFDDLLMSNWTWNGNRGRVWTVRGQAPQAEPGAATIICVGDDDELGQGDNGGDLLGYGLASADIDGDGCDDHLAGAYNADPQGYTNSGKVHVWMGYGGPGCRAAPAEVSLVSGSNNDNLGYRVVTADMNGDGTLDIVAGSSGYGSTNIGAVLVFDGLEVRRLISGAGSGAVVDVSGATLAIIEDPTGVSNVNFSIGLASMGDVNNDGFDDIVVGAQLSSLSGPDRSGGAFVFLGSDQRDALQKVDVVIAGETTFPDGRFGYSVSGARIGDDAPFSVMVGSPFSEWRGARFGDMGAVYVGNQAP